MSAPTALQTNLPKYEPALKPYAHQISALEKGWKRREFAFLMDMGTGKSKTLIDNACLLYEDNKIDALLIFAPKGVYTNWTKPGGELDTHLWPSIKEQSFVYTWVSGKTGKRKSEEQAVKRLMDDSSPGLRVLVVNCEALSSVKDSREFCEKFVKIHRTLVAADESYVFADPDSNRTKAAQRIFDKASYTRILTGFLGNPTKIYSQFQLLRRGLLGFTSYYTYRERFCLLREIAVGSRTVKSVVGYRNVEELSDMVTKHAYRARKKDCLDLPPKIYTRRSVELTEEQEKAYRELRRTAMTVLSEQNVVTTEIVLTQLLRLHQVVCGHVTTDDGRVIRLASNRMKELLDVIASTDEQTIIWCGYKPDLRQIVLSLREQYGDDQVVEYHGEVPDKLRAEAEESFQSGKARIIVANQQTAGRGRTWTAATMVIYYSNTSSVELRMQSEDRAHRIGQKSAVTYVDLVCPNTIDEKMLEALRAERDVALQILKDGPSNWF